MGEVGRRDSFLAQSEIDKADMSLGVEQHVLGLQVSVHDAVRVQAFERQNDLGAVVTSTFLGETTVRFQMEEQLTAVEVLCDASLQHNTNQTEMM
jgi:hypothetical protein